jgi:cell division transport system permease protein
MFSLASIATMSACIFLFGLFYSIITNFQYIVKSAEEGVAVTVFFDDDISDERITEIGVELEGQAGVREIKYVSAEEAWEGFQEEYFGDNASLAEGFKDDNPLANSANYEVYMSDVSMQSKVVSFAEGLEGVRKVNKSDVVAKTLSSVNVLISYAAIAIILILLAVSIFLISNTVTIGITVRSEEIAIMKYIGAKDSFVRLPFLTEGIIIGLIGSGIPLILLYFLYSRAVEYIMVRFSLLKNILDFLPVGYVYKTLLPISILLGIGIGFVGSFFTTRKHLKV